MKIEIELTPEQIAQISVQARSNQAWVLQSAQGGLRPGQTVQDVGTLDSDESHYVGTVNPDTLDRLDWAWYSQNKHRLKVGEYELFDRKAWLGNRSTGYLYHAGDLASADLSGYYVAGSVFGPYLK